MGKVSGCLEAQQVRDSWSRSFAGTMGLLPQVNRLRKIIGTSCQSEL
jgi:hypothetical protein